VNDFEISVENEVISSTLLYRPHGSRDEYAELGIWYGSLLDYVQDSHLKRLILVNLITDTKRSIANYEDQLIGLTDEERDKRWIRRDLTSFYTTYVLSRGELLRRNIDEEKRDLEKYEGRLSGLRLNFQKICVIMMAPKSVFDTYWA
jgi:hypothetical protein